MCVYDVCVFVDGCVYLWMDVCICGRVCVFVDGCVCICRWMRVYLWLDM